MAKRRIAITDNDKKRLLSLIADALDEKAPADRPHLDELMAELNRGKLVPSKQVKPDVVTMNSRAVLRDLDTEEAMTYTLVFPKDASLDEDRVSVLAPIGTAILGYSVGDTVEWKVPRGQRRLRIEALEYQPEAAGDYDL